MVRVARLLLGQGIGECRLPEVSGDRLDLMLAQAEVRHLGCRAEISRLLQPHRNPVLIQLEADVLQVRPDLLYIFHQVVSMEIELLQARRDLAAHSWGR